MGLRDKLHRVLNPYALIVGVVILGSVLPDFDVLWHTHRGWTHNIYIPVVLSIGLVVAYILRFYRK